MPCPPYLLAAACALTCYWAPYAGFGGAGERWESGPWAREAVRRGKTRVACTAGATLQDALAKVGWFPNSLPCGTSVQLAPVAETPPEQFVLTCSKTLSRMLLMTRTSVAAARRDGSHVKSRSTNGTAPWGGEMSALANREATPAPQ
jgi:hypothetical protein